MIKIPAVFGTMMVVFLLVDLLWLGVFAKGYYQRQIGHLMAEQVNWTAAVIFYAIYIAGVLFFAVMPAHSMARAFVLGGALGFLAYATYDMTNWATLKDWPASMVAVDLVWGTVLTGFTAAVGFMAAQRLS